MRPEPPARMRAAATASPGLSGSPFRGSVADLRLGIYVAALVIAYALDLAIVGRDRGAAFWAVSAAAALALAFGFGMRGWPLRAGALGATAIAIAVPLGQAVLDGASFGPILSEGPLWPQILVALFASRVLAEDCEMRFARFWRAPGAAPGPVGLQSAGAALALGAALTLAFYQGLDWLAPGHPAGTGVGAIVLAALTGETAIHRAILFLFFTLVAFLFDAALRHARDRGAFRAVRRAARASAEAGRPLRARDIRRLLGSTLAELGHLRGLRLVEEACMRVETDAPLARALATASFDLFHTSTRRFVRALLPILPMLGFFGTVVGLATAMAALPTTTPEGHGVDISASLSGLAVKFQTTLLGIMASLLVSSLLAILDRNEAGLAAECALFVAEAETDHAA